ncbi:MAG: L-threonine 3-dehydrogenase [Chlamydiales bacterium]|nr:L-threonine 3-dehydrogenase [Chlamydiales bacterium]
MKALVKKFAKEGLWLEEVPTPTPGPNEVLIKTRKTAICGTDVHIYKWDAWAQKTISVPLVTGHEFMGEIAALGAGVTGFNVGQRVSGEGHIVCNRCRNCRTGTKHVCLQTKGVGVQRHGCFAEYFTLPVDNVYILPDNIPDDIATIFDPYGNAVHTALSFDLVGEDVLVTGAGPIGLMAVAIAKKAGARNVVITDLNPYRLELAEKLGATAAVNIGNTDLDSVMKKLRIHEGFTVGMEMSGSPKGLNSLLQHMQPAGKVALLGILPPNTLIDWDLVIFRGLLLKGIYGREMFSTWYKMEHLLQAGLDIAPVITHRFPYAEFDKGFQVMLSGNSGKVILDWE